MSDIRDRAEKGQFDDAEPDQTSTGPSANPREGLHFIDDEEAKILEWSEDEDEDEDEFDLEEDELEYEAYHTLRAEDEDWEIAERGTP